MKQAETAKQENYFAFRYYFAIHLLKAGYDKRRAQKLLVYEENNATSIYGQVKNTRGNGNQKAEELVYFFFDSVLERQGD